MSASPSKESEEQRTRVVGYVRVSTDEQADKGHSLGAQRAKLKAYCELHELDLVGLREEDKSAKNLERPELLACLDDLREGRAEALLVLKLDRLTRRVRDLDELIEGYFKDDGAALLSVSEHIDTRSAAGRMVLNMLAVVSQWERETIGERTSMALQHLKAQGLWNGGNLPMGKQPEDPRLDARGERLPRRVISSPEELEAVEDAVRLRGSGMSLRAIADELQRLGHRPRRSESWTHEVVRRMIQRAEPKKAG